MKLLQHTKYYTSAIGPRARCSFSCTRTHARLLIFHRQGVHQVKLNKRFNLTRALRASVPSQRGLWKVVDAPDVGT